MTFKDAFIPLLIGLLLHIVDQGWSPDWDEPWFLRWIRAGAAHPERTAVAAFLFVRGLQGQQMTFTGPAKDQKPH